MRRGGDQERQHEQHHQPGAHPARRERDGQPAPQRHAHRRQPAAPFGYHRYGSVDQPGQEQDRQRRRDADEKGEDGDDPQPQRQTSQCPAGAGEPVLYGSRFSRGRIG